MHLGWFPPSQLILASDLRFTRRTPNSPTHISMSTFQLPSGIAFMENSGRGADILVVDVRTGKSTLYPTSLVREIYDLS